MSKNLRVFAIWTVFLATTPATAQVQPEMMKFVVRATGVGNLYRQQLLLL